MAVAFYIPDQATLLRKAKQQEQQIQRMREAQWKFIASIILDALQQCIGSSPYCVLGRSSSSVRKNCRDKLKKFGN
ncbi:cell death protein rpr [Teleopsis dalmanni]|uniref:cell death protein rpr n=1 Tax=Teleopsis dalmanni TaxID=139649 RepID=UPI0018CD7A15|nr:cell death protein rpr [Teleopsis dalmanni]